MTLVEQLQYIKDAFKNKIEFYSRERKDKLTYIIQEYNKDEIHVASSLNKSFIYPYTIDSFFEVFEEVKKEVKKEEKDFSETEKLYHKLIDDFHNNPVYVCKTWPRAKCTIKSIDCEVNEDKLPRVSVCYQYLNTGNKYNTSAEKFLNEFEKEDNSMYVIFWGTEYLISSKDIVENKLNELNDKGYIHRANFDVDKKEYAVYKLESAKVRLVRMTIGD